jgi:proline iminopeptidase
MAEGYLTVSDGVRLYYRTEGSGEEVVVFPNGVMLQPDLAHLAHPKDGPDGVAPGRTLVFYDPRNRGRSDLAEAARPSRGVQDDVDDLEAVRRHFGVEAMALFGHSYAGLMVALHAMTYPASVTRIVQMSPSEPRHGVQYPPHLQNADDLLRDTLMRLGALQAERATMTSPEFCRKFWAILRPIYVANPAHVDRIRWARCDDPNEVGFLAYWLGSILPSLQALEITPAMAARVTAPVLIVHGKQDRSAPYGGARDWAALLPDARLLTVEHAAHAPWLEQPDEVMPALELFLSGAFPDTAERLNVV